MSNELFSPRQDIVFKMLFGSEGSTDILTAFLKAVLPLSDDEYAEVTLLNPISTSDFPDDKICILDVKVKTAKGRVIDVEIQVANKTDLRERIVYYLSKMVTEQVGKGESYLTIKPSVCILITDFVLVPENARYHNRYRLRDFATGSEFTDLMEVNTLELPKLPDNSDGTPEWFWLAFLKDDREEVYEVLSDNNPDVKKAVVRLKELSADEKARLVFEARQKAEWDQLARDKFVRQEGRQEALLSVARNLIKLGRTLEEIAQATGLSAEEIRSLLH